MSFHDRISGGTLEVEKFGEVGLSDIHVDTFLSGLSIDYVTEGFIADMVIPGVKVTKESDKFPVWGREHLKSSITIRADGAKANTVRRTLSDDNYDAEEHALKTFTTLRERNNADDPVDLEESAVFELHERLMRRREKAAADLVFDETNFPATNKLDVSTTAQWDNNNGTPFIEVQTGIRTVSRLCGRRPNLIVIGAQVFDQLTIHDDILNRTNTVSDKSVTEELLAKLWRVERVLIGEAVEDTEPEGIDEILVDIWGKNLLIAHVAKSAGLRTQSLAYRFWTREGRVRRWFDQETENDWFENSGIYDLKLVSTNCGYLLHKAIA